MHGKHIFKKWSNSNDIGRDNMNTTIDESEGKMENIVFFIVSGFTKSVVEKAPLGNEFFIKAFDPKNDISRETQIKNVKKFIEKYIIH